jgi:aminocarboxymuconate-semialdehyde decarboxylase
MIIDVHAHALSEKFLSDLQRNTVAGWSSERDAKGGFWIRRPGEQPHSLDPNLHDMRRRLESLQRRRVECQLFGPSPGFMAWQGGAAGVELARTVNAHAKEIEAQSQGLMEAMAILPLSEPERAVAELERAVDEDGFRSIMLPTSAGGRPLDDAAFADLFAVIERRELLAFMHPTSAFPTDRFGINGMNVLLGWPFETTLAVARLIFGGVFDRHPALKLILSHSGGNLMFLRGRLDAAYDATGWEAHPYYRKHINRRPTFYLDRLYYDTCALSAGSIAFTLDTMSDRYVLFGSDYPFDVGDPEGAVAFPIILALSPQSQARILRDNARALLGAP